MPANLSLSVLNNIRVASPCPARWQDMKGDDKTRHCDQCNHNVHNFAAMTTDEIASIVGDGQRRVCVRLFQRPDGTILTADCPVGLALIRSKARRTAGRIVALVGIVITAGVLWAKGRDNSWDQAKLSMLEPFATTYAKLSPTPPQRASRMIMGMMIAPPRPSSRGNQ